MFIQTLRQNKIISKICSFFDSPYYSLSIGVFVIVIHMLGWELVGFAVLAICICFTNLFASDTRSAIVPLFLISLVMAQQDSSQSVSDRFLSAHMLITLIILGVLLISTAVLRLIIDKKFKRLFTKTRLLYGFIALSASLLLGGIFSKTNMAESLMISGSLTLTGLVFYVFFSSTMEHRDDNITYLCKAAAVAAGVIIFELAWLYILKYEKGTTFDYAWKGKIVFGWGISNVIGELLAFLLAPIFYLAFTERHGWLYYELAVADMVAVFFTLCRNALLFGVLLFVLCTVLCIIKGKNSLGVSISASVVVIALLFAVVLRFDADSVKHVFAFFTDRKLSDSGRFALWKEYFGRFKSYPIFGTGFATLSALDYSNMLAHNTIFQIMGSCGIVGLGAYLYHRFETMMIYLKKPTFARSFLGISVFSFLLMALLDPIFFYAHFIIYYTLILVVSEKEADYTLKTLFNTNFSHRI